MILLGGEIADFPFKIDILTLLIDTSGSIEFSEERITFESEYGRMTDTLLSLLAKHQENVVLGNMNR